MQTPRDGKHSCLVCSTTNLDLIDVVIARCGVCVGPEALRPSGNTHLQFYISFATCEVTGHSRVGPRA